MSGRCGDGMAGVYREGNGFALRGGGRTVRRLPCALLAMICALLLTGVGAVAQPASPPAAQPASPAAQPAASDTADDTNADMKDEIAAARQQQRTTAATRQQIQAIRAALRARLATLHH